MFDISATSADDLLVPFVKNLSHEKKPNLNIQISGMACVRHSSRFSRKVHQDQQDAEETPITHSRDSKLSFKR